MCIDFRKNERCPKSVYIKGEAVERADTYKYLCVVFDSKLNWKENINTVLKKSELKNVLHEKAQIIWSQFRYMLVTFYNAIIHSLITFGSVCWGGNISKFDRGRLKKMIKQAGHVVEKPLDGFKILHEKRLYRKLMQIDPTHPMRYYFDSRCSNRNGRFLLLRTNTVIKPHFYPQLWQFLVKIIPVIWLCVRGSILLCQRKHYSR